MEILSPEAAQRLAEDAQRYRDYAEMSSDWYWEQDEAFRFTYFSREFEEVTGVPSASGLGKTRWQGLGRERLSDVDWDEHQRLLEAHRPFRNFEYPSRRPDGKIVWFRVSGKPRFAADGRFVGYYGIASDISAGRLLASRLQQSERLAAIGQLAAGTAHEINNPIGFVRSNVETLRTYLDQLLAVATRAEAVCAEPSPTAMTALAEALRTADVEFLREDAPQLLDESRDGLDRVRKIVADLREFAREGQTEWGNCRLCDCIDSAINLIGSKLPASAHIERRYADLPPLRGQPVHLSQVAHALLLNATLALPATGGRIVVSTGREDEATQYVEIADNGCGIAPENLPHVFEPFFTTREPGRGTGMGLATCFGIVSEHGGRIEAHSAPGSGSRFRVTLPERGA
ncbi:MAG: ATP-binding protein [Rhodocyclaceae bacterium]|nr:ATP-binding protein [Rhodocyclaceae bacterium]